MIQFDPPSAELLAELREKHGDALREVEDGDRLFIFARPEGKIRGYVDRFVTMASSESKRLEASEQVVKACCVWPDKDTLKRVLEDEPGLAMSLADPATDCLGMRKLVVKK